ncbi:MAG: DegT/DnrJ/EryC1/StrS family aminotransferase [Deltaproteobacteria bacterium]|nr:MAG: DegT/DnrJ/EryC1/StrS family aminotransferase [Deltaproteobacteria bacterium]
MTYKVRFVDMPKHYKSLRNEILAIVDEVLSRGDVILREDLRRFEEDFASFVGTRYAVGVNSGTDALFFSLRAAGVGSGDEVITVAHTFVATVAAIIHNRAVPVLVDVGKDFNMDMDKLEEAITPKTKAIVPVHLNGRLCDMKRLMSIAQRHNLIVIEDACQSLGARFRDKKAGSFGLTGCFSLYPFKMLGAFGDGGVVTTNDEELAEKIKLFRDHGQNRKTGDVLFYGFNSRLDNLQAAILSLKLKYLPRWIEKRRRVAEIYRKGLSDIPQLKLPHFSGEEYFDVYQNYVIRAERRDELVKFLGEKGIEVLISWPRPLHHHKGLNLRRFHLSETERISKEVVSLPMNTEIDNEQVEYVIECIRDFYSN